MERSEYDKLDRVEDHMWWFAASHRSLLMLLEHRSKPTTDQSWTLAAGWADFSPD